MAGQPQQQSIVFEFSCLWTLNKTQKLKNWHDGTLRFHQFNRRALVYDDQHRLVVVLSPVGRLTAKDDCFLPHRDMLSAGDELEFEKILVSLEEGNRLFSATLMLQELGQCTQDLTPLYHRQQRLQPLATQNQVCFHDSLI